MTVRPAVATDVPAVAALEATVFGMDAWSATTVADELEAGHRLALVATDSGGLQGYAVAAVTADLADLHRVVVDPDHRRRGLATSLLSELRTHCRAAGVSRMLLEVSADNTAARAFYLAGGWSELDRRARYYRDGSDAVVLALDLAREPV